MTIYCPECGSSSYSKAGFSSSKSHKVQILRCSECARRFQSDYVHGPLRPQHRDWDFDTISAYQAEVVKNKRETPEYKAKKRIWNRNHYLKLKDSSSNS